MEIRCRGLSEEEIWSEVTYLSQLVGIFGADQVVVWYGWDCSLDIDELWKDIVIPSNGFEEFVRESERKGIYRIRKSDHTVRNDHVGVAFTLCHDGDIHCEGPESFVSTIEARWAERGFHPYLVSKLRNGAKPSV
ncbi:MAG: hypothetical protein ACXWAT_11595 [Methylobacter sp.]